MCITAFLYYLSDLALGGVWPLCALTSLEMDMQNFWRQAVTAGVGQGCLLLKSQTTSL